MMLDRDDQTKCMLVSYDPNPLALFWCHRGSPATLAALDPIEHLQAQHGDLIAHLSAGCCDGRPAALLRAAATNGTLAGKRAKGER